MTPDWEDLVARARALVPADGGGRVVLGIAGLPGAGKSTLASGLVDRLGTEAVQLPMDGFHLADAQLDRLGLRDRKGAPETFDAAGYAALLARVAAGNGGTVYAPGFERTLEQPLAAAVAVLPEHRVVVTEGNYLLLPGVWEQARRWCAQVWFATQDEDRRLARLVERHVQFGKSPAQAREWVHRSDEANAALVRQARERADLVVVLD